MVVETAILTLTPPFLKTSFGFLQPINLGATYKVSRIQIFTACPKVQMNTSPYGAGGFQVLLGYIPSIDGLAEWKAKDEATAALVWRIYIGLCRPENISKVVIWVFGEAEVLQPPQPPTDVQPPGSGTDEGPQIIECVFPTLSLNFISVMSGLASWIGCIIRNIIILLQWIVGWILHFPDHLDAWISRLFGVDPSLPFFDEVLKKVDVWISGKFGVDPALPFWEELVKKALAWIGGVLDAAAEERMRIRGWK